VKLREEVANVFESCNIAIHDNSIDDICEIFAPASPERQFLDPNIQGGGGRAVLIRDLFSLHDVLRALGDSVVSVLFENNLGVTALKVLADNF